MPSAINITNEFKLQSPFLYCQAAGSDGSDGSKQGIHLRWDLLKELGDNHIPKGNLTNVDNGAFNKEDDFVHIYRTPFLKKYAVVINFEEIEEMSDNPDDFAGQHQIELLPVWEGIAYKRYPGDADTVLFKFKDRTQFIGLVSSYTNELRVNFINLLKQYTGVMEIEVSGKLLFAYDFGARVNYTPVSSSNGIFKYEAACLKDTADINSLHLMSRKYFFERELRQGYPKNMQCKNFISNAENIRFIRTQHSRGYLPLKLVLYPYQNYFDGTNRNSMWEYIGEFGLTLTDAEVHKRIEGGEVSYAGGVPQFTINWLKHIDASLVPQNYLDRWMPSAAQNQPGIKALLQQFINLSNTDPRAEANNPSEDSGDYTSFSTSLLDLLKLAATDYHAARIFGLGTIDGTLPPELLQSSYIYAAVYSTETSLPGITGAADHVYMTLPTSINDYMLPLPPVLNPVTYGLRAVAGSYVENENETGNAGREPMSDDEGYSFYEDIRFVNLNKINQGLPQPLLVQIPDNAAFDITGITQPLTFGIKYKLASDAGWRKPELLHDDYYTDTESNFENISTPDQQDTPVYIHFETEQGIHDYALYSINWFSRASNLSNIQHTDNTVFKKRNRLLPPSNVSAQYIQEEDPMIFTTQAEQNYITANQEEDNRIRVTFDWDEIQINAYQYADKVEFFFRETPLTKIEGVIKSVTSLSNDECLIVSGQLQIFSVSDPVTIDPAVTPGTEHLFIGSTLTTSEGHFELLEIIQPVTGSPNGPSFRVRKIISRELHEAEQGVPGVLISSGVMPNVNDTFFILENVSDSGGGWLKLNQSLELYNFPTSPGIDEPEMVFESDSGESRLEYTGGIKANATITKIMVDDEDTPGNTADDVFQGGYRVTFGNTVILPELSADASISWYKGTARFKIAGSQRKKTLPVLQVESFSPLQFVVFDRDYLNTEDTDEIETGVDIQVNYHPGYKIYLSAEPGFNNQVLLPQGSSNTKKTYLVLRSADTTETLYSSFTLPLVIVARNIQKPVEPEAVVGSLFTTRPDTFGKSTLTVDVKLQTTGRIPYGVVVYRANEMDVLATLYKKETIDAILTGLAAIESETEKNEIWIDLIEAKLDLENLDSFKIHSPSNFFFPKPDNDKTPYYLDANTVSYPFPLTDGITLTDAHTAIKHLIEYSFTPLTEVPIVFEYVKPGFETSPKKPSIRNIVGKLLSPADPSFDPFPMAVKFPAITPHTIRITDYEIQGTARNIYFYFAREVSVNSKYSKRSPILGPVRLVDASPAEVPVIRKIVTQEASVINKPAVVFEMANYIESESIERYQIYRSTDYTKTASTKTMKLASLCEAATVIKDEFTDLPFPLFGEAIYYRIVAMRKITNERNQTEYIPSKPSTVIVAGLIDVENPAPAKLNYRCWREEMEGPNGELSALINVSFWWKPTTYNGKYYLYRMNAKGNWDLIWSKKTNISLINVPERNNFHDYPDLGNLKKLDNSGNVIYHRFKLVVENASGLVNLKESELVL